MFSLLRHGKPFVNNYFLKIVVDMQGNPCLYGFIETMEPKMNNYSISKMVGTKWVRFYEGFISEAEARNHLYHAKIAHPNSKWLIVNNPQGAI